MSFSACVPLPSSHTTSTAERWTRVSYSGSEVYTQRNLPQTEPFRISSQTLLGRERQGTETLLGRDGPSSARRPEVPQRGARPMYLTRPDPAGTHRSRSPPRASRLPVATRLTSSPGPAQRKARQGRRGRPRAQSRPQGQCRELRGAEEGQGWPAAILPRRRAPRRPAAAPLPRAGPRGAATHALRRAAPSRPRASRRGDVIASRRQRPSDCPPAAARCARPPPAARPRRPRMRRPRR